MKSFIPFIVIAICISMFFFYIKPTYSFIQDRQAKLDEYNNVLTKVKEIKVRTDALVSKYNGISSQDLDKLNKMIPGKFIPEYFANDLNSISSKYGMRITQLQVSVPQTVAVVSDDTQTEAGKYITVTARFNLSGQYDQFVSFLKDLESSLRLIDVVGITVKPRGAVDKQTDIILDYAVEVKTYALK